MHNFLIFAPGGLRGPAAVLAKALRSTGHNASCPELDIGCADAVESLIQAFEGRPPDILVTDLSSATDTLPLRYIQRMLRHVWGESLQPIVHLALLSPCHLGQPDWPAHVDDFLLPPYNEEELLARVTALLFRRRHIQPDATLPFAGILLDLAGCQAWDSEGHILSLTPREFDLLRFLCIHRGKYFSRDSLLDLVWGVGFEGSARTVDIHVRRLRTKLPTETAALLETRRGIGYGFRLSA